MYPRAASTRLQELWRQFPGVLILGARQVGKTTLARQSFPSVAYCDLEDPNLRRLFSEDPVFQIESRAKPSLILDEAQSVPEVFAALRGLIDARRKQFGRFLILGSASPQLIRSISESLAGRIGILELDPLTAAEIRTAPPSLSVDDLWLRGGFPDALTGSFREWWEAYLRTFIERDLPYLHVGADPILLRRLLTMLAHRQGGLLNASDFARSLGVSHHTVQRYLDVLEQTFLVRRLPPYFRNVGKRLTKAPKVYLRDTGLLHHLLNIGSLDDLANHPIRGASWETFVIEEIIRREKLRAPHTQFFFWRTAAGAEVDLVLEQGSRRIAIEVKAGRGLDPRAAQGLAAAMEDIDATTGWIIDQADGVEPLRPKVNRRGFGEDLDWHPE
jgi:predicted AAA+ superfamily ATPase